MRHLPGRIMPSRALLACALVVICALVPVLAARADGPWRRFAELGDSDPNQGLLSNDIRALAYGGSGEHPLGTPSLWVGTDLGLQVYNGRDWRDPSGAVSDTTSDASSVDITSLLFDETEGGLLWVGTGRGVNWRTPEGAWETSDLGGMAARALAPDGAGGTYVATESQVWRCRTDESDEMGCEAWRTGLSDVRALLYHNGTLWIGTADGLRRSVGALLIPYTVADGLISDLVTALAADGRDRLWVGTDKGISRFDERARPKWHSYPEPGYTYSVAVDDRDVVWAASEGGLVRWDPRWEGRAFSPDSWKRVALPAGDLGEELPTLVYAQPAGVLWVVSGAGLNVLDNSWTTYGPEETAPGLLSPPSQVNALLRDESTGELWAGTDAGIVRYAAPTDEWDRAWAAADGLKGQVLSLVRDPESRVLWAGTDAGVFSCVGDCDRWTRVGSASDDVGSGTVWALARDGQQGELWAGAENGLHRYDEDAGGWLAAWPQDGRSGEVVYRIVSGEQTGTLWLGTGTGVVRYDPRTGESQVLWPDFEQVSYAPLVALLVDEGTGELWVGTGNQLLYYDGSGWFIGQPPPAELYALARDAEPGVLWAGAATGVFRYDPHVGRWDDASAGVSGVVGQPARSLLRDGDLWVGGDAAIARWATSADRAPPWARITRALSGEVNRLQEDGGVKLLDARGVDYQFEGGSQIAGLGDLRYGYQLVGVDLALRWATPAQGLQAPYPDLPYGTHAFELWALDALGRQSSVRRYPLVVQARPIITLTEIHGQAVGASGTVSLTIDPGEQVPYSLRWSDPDDPDSPPEIRALWSDQTSVVTQSVQSGESLQRDAAAYGLSPRDVLGAKDIFDVNMAYVGQLLHGPPNVATALTPTPMAGDQIAGTVSAPESGGPYQLVLQGVDADGNVSTPHQPVLCALRTPIDWGRFLPWAGWFLGTVAVLALGWSLRRYPDYASSWGEAHGNPVEQLIPLVAPLNEPLDVARVQAVLQERQAFTTPEQVQVALQMLVRRRILTHAEEGRYVFVDRFVAWLHRLRNLGRRDSLAEAVRSRHPLYAGARNFFAQARYEPVDLTAEAFLLIPAGASHPHASYGPVYTRLAAGHALEGDDFEAVGEMARSWYDGEVSHRLAFVVINRRPTPGARLRLYEIRQSSGLAIVTLDSELFGQVKPNMPASDILAAQIDQATGRQNLYAISGPVSDDLSFFGRETVLQQVVDLIDAGQPVGVFGLRKTGKTSLLQRLRGRLATRRVIASLDMQGMAREHGVLPLYPAIIGALVAHIQRYRAGLARSIPSLHLWPAPRGRTLTHDVSRVFADDLRELHALIGGDERLLLIVDEVDRLLPAGEDPGYEGFSTFLGQLRAANQGLQVLDLIVAGVDPAINRRDKWGERDSELYQALREVWLPPMRPEATQEMVESMGFQMGFQYEPAALARIVDAGGGQPFLTRQICGQVVSDLLDRGTATITDEQARLGIEDYVYLPDSYLTELWRARLGEAERAVLLRLAQADAPIPREDLLPDEQRQTALLTLGWLEERMVIRRDDGAYRVGWPILRSWIRWIELGLES